MQNYVKIFMKLTYLSIFVSGNIIFYEIMFFSWKVKAEIWRIKFSLEKKNWKAITSDKYEYSFSQWFRPSCYFQYIVAEHVFLQKSVCN